MRIVVALKTGDPTHLTIRLIPPVIALSASQRALPDSHFRDGSRVLPFFRNQVWE